MCARCPTRPLVDVQVTDYNAANAPKSPPPAPAGSLGRRLSSLAPNPLADEDTLESFAEIQNELRSFLDSPEKMADSDEFLAAVEEVQKSTTYWEFKARLQKLESQFGVQSFHEVDDGHGRKIKQIGCDVCTW